MGFVKNAMKEAEVEGPYKIMVGCGCFLFALWICVVMLGIVALSVYISGKL